jgi:hypothetical protein
MDREVKNSYRQCLAEVGGILAPSARTGLADLAPGVKVVQTVVCSTFTPGAKPAPRRVADGERMNPPRECAFAQIPEDHEHQGDENIKRRTRPQMTCPLRARSAGQRRGLTGTSGQPVTPAHVRKAGRPAAHTGLPSKGSLAGPSDHPFIGSSRTGAVNRLVNRTQRDRLRRARCRRLGTTSRRRAAKVNAVTRDCPRQRGRTSVGS